MTDKPTTTPGALAGRKAYLCGYLIPLRSIGNAGPYGCDPCVDCGKRPAEGDPVYMLSACLLCEACAGKAAKLI